MILKNRYLHLFVLFLIVVFFNVSLNINFNNKIETQLVDSFHEHIKLIKNSEIDKDSLYVNHNIIQLIYKDKEIVSKPNSYNIIFYFDTKDFNQYEINNNLGYFLFDKSLVGEYEILYIKRLSTSEVIDNNFLYLSSLLSFITYILICFIYLGIENKHFKFNNNLKTIINNDFVDDHDKTFLEIKKYVMFSKLFQKCISFSPEALIVLQDDKIIFYNNQADKFLLNDQFRDINILEFSKKKNFEKYYSTENEYYFIETKLIEIRNELYNCMYITDETLKVEFTNNKEVFFNQASHEIRTPLTNLSGYVDLLCNCELTKEDKSEMLVDGIEECRKLDILITSILDISKRLEQDDVIIKTDFSDLINDCLYPFRYNKIKPEIILKGNYRFLCNRAKVQVLLSNLLENAFLHNISNGFVKIEFDEYVGLHEFTITNSSKVINDDEFEKLYEPFFKCESNDLNRGAGLGLTLSKCICETNNFHMEINYDDDKFSVRVKLYPNHLSRHMKK